MPITHIQSAGGATISAQIQTKTSPQGTPTGQPTPILPNTPLSPPSGMTTVTLNTRPILPQQQQQQRKISAGKLWDLQIVSCVFTPCMLLRKRFLLHRRLVSRKNWLLSWIPASLSYLEKRMVALCTWGTGRGEGRGTELKEYFLTGKLLVSWIFTPCFFANVSCYIGD